MTTVRDGATIHDIPAEDVFFSTTDRKGVIFQANDMFVRMARRDRNQLVGAPHSIIRHPDMPAGAFHLLWNRLLDGDPVAAYVLNQAGDGSAYWAFGTIAPLGSGFLSVRCRPTRLDLFAAADAIYREVRPMEIETRAAGVPAREAARMGAEALEAHLASVGFTSYDDFMMAAAPAEVASRRALFPALPSRPHAQGVQATMLQTANQIDTTLAPLAEALGTSAETGATIENRLQYASGSVHQLLDALADASAVIVTKAEEEPMLAQAATSLTDQIRSVSASLDTSYTHVQAVATSRKRLNFVVAIARLQAEMVGQYVIALIDGKESAADSDDAIRGLSQALSSILTNTELALTEDAAATSSLAGDIDSVSNTLRIVQMLLTKWRGLLASRNLTDSLGEILPRLDAALTEVTSAVTEVRSGSEALTSTVVGFNRSELQNYLAVLTHTMAGAR